MRRYWVPITISIVLLGALAAYFISLFSGGGAGLSRHVLSKDMSAVNDYSGGDRAGHEARESSRAKYSVESSHSAAISNSFEPREYGYAWDSNNPGIARNEEDAKWLEAHGYPGPDVETYLKEMALGPLKDLADRGNPAAQAIYAYRLAKQDAPKSEVQGILLESAVSGSVYALKMAGDIYFTVDGYRDLAVAKSYYGMQARVGDQAGFVQGYLVGAQLTNEQRLRAEIIEEATWRNIDSTEDASSSIRRDARPGYMQFMEAALGRRIQL